MKSVGIDIGSYSIKVAEVEAAGKNAGAVIGFTEYPLNPDPRADRQLETVEALRKIAAAYDPTQTRFVVAVPQGEVSVRLKIFPFKERLKILKSLAFELEDEIPLDLDDSVFEAKICEYFGDSAEVLALACPNESVADTLTRLKDGGVDPDIVSAEGVALSNVFERWQLPPPQLPASAAAITDDPEGTLAGGRHERPTGPTREARLVLDIGHTRTLLLCYREGVLISARSIFWGGIVVAENLARTFNVPLFQAVDILKRKSFILMNTAGASRDQITSSQAVCDATVDLIRELRLSILDLKTEHNLHFSGIDLLGGVSQIQNFGPYLTQMLELPANLYHHFPNHKAVLLEPSPGLEAVSPVAIGLAFEGLKKPRNPAVNFRKGEFTRQNKTLQLLWEQWRPAVIAGVTGLVLFTMFSFIRDMMADDLLSIVETRVTEQAEGMGLAKNQRSVSGVKKFVNETEKQIQARQQLAKLDGFNSAMDILQKIVSHIPVGETQGGARVALAVKRLNIDNDSVVFEGRVLNQQHVDVVRKAIEKVALPKSIVKGNTTGGGQGTPFTFEFKVNRLADN